MTQDTDPIAEAEHHLALARTTGDTEHTRLARSALERARRELAELRRLAGPTPPPGLVADLDDIARRVYRLELRVAPLAEGTMGNFQPKGYRRW